MVERSIFEESLTPEDVVELVGPMKELIRHPSWSLFVEAIKGAIIRARELGFEDEHSRIDYWKGYVAGLQEARATPGALISLGEGMAIREDAKPVRQSYRGTLTSDGDPSF